MLVYLAVGLSALSAAGPGILSNAAAPLTAAVHAAGSGELAPVVRIGGAVASAGALLALIAGIGRTSLAMSRERDLPSWLSAVHPRYRVPHRAELAVGLVVCVLIATIGLRGSIGFSSFGVLLYYAVANLAAFNQDRAHRRWPRALNVLGVLGCVTLAASLPAAAVGAGIVLVAVGLLGRLGFRRLDKRARPRA
jgi:APA family basic amino acid/polyamine antiporter